MRAQQVESGLPSGRVGAGEQLVDPGRAQADHLGGLAHAEAVTVGGDHSPGPLCLGRLEAEPGTAEPGFEREVGLVARLPAVPAGMQLGSPHHGSQHGP